MPRLALLVLPALLALAAGCVAPTVTVTVEPPATGPAATSGTPAPLAAKDFTGSGTVVAGEEGVVLVPIGEVCGVPTSQCRRYPFEVTGEPGGAPLDLRATLSWGIPANDFDLHLLDGEGAYLHIDMEPPPADRVTWNRTLAEPGKYALVVVPFTTVADSYTLTAAFAPAT